MSRFGNLPSRSCGSTGQFPPAFPIELVAKDFDLVRRSAAAAVAEVPVCEATRAVFMAGVEAGFGDDNITGIVQLYND
jgi:3-hydroxyisobutyrate dehydrogenase-like beta-hydroxyacid dehydrogenase